MGENRVNRRREIMRRLGAVKHCGCGVEIPFESPDACPDCHHKNKMARIKQEANEFDRYAAVEATRWYTSESYKEACAAMEEDVAAALGSWQIGNGVRGPR